MNTVLIIHGLSGHAGIHWQQWLHDELEGQDCKVLMPDMPEPDHPNRQTWLDEIKKTLKGVNLGQLTIVGHSLGTTTALDFIEQADGRINRLLSVAGFARDYGAAMNSYFLSQKSVDFDKVRDKIRWAAVVYGDDDPYVPQDELKFVADALAVRPLVIPGGGHLNTESGFTEFPQLIEMLK